MKTYFFLLLALLAVTFQSCKDSNGKNVTTQRQTGQIPVKVIALHKQNLSSRVEASGQFTTDDETYLSFKTGGVIEKIFKKEGDAVKKGELLATLNLTEINAQVAQAQLAFDKARRDLDRVTNLYRDSVATLEQFQNVRTGMEVAEKQLEAARFNHTYSEIHAIGDGYILKKLANVGQVITSGTPVFQTNGAKRGEWILKVAVSDKAWTRISIGDPASIIVDANDQKLNGRVSRKSEGIDPYTGSFIIEIALVGKQSFTLATGLFGKASITPSFTEQVWIIPYDALLDGNAQSGYVFVTNDNTIAQKVKVAIASIAEENVIVSAGLENAQALIVTGSAYLKDSSSIKVLN